MQVRDLIYLLQTRAKPEDEIVFTTYIDCKDRSMTFQVYEETYDFDFNSIYTEDSGVYEGSCMIQLPKGTVKTILKADAELNALPAAHKEEPFKVKKSTKGKAAKESTAN